MAEPKKKPPQEVLDRISSYGFSYGDDTQAPKSGKNVPRGTKESKNIDPELAQRLASYGFSSDENEAPKQQAGGSESPAQEEVLSDKKGNWRSDRISGAINAVKGIGNAAATGLAQGTYDLINQVPTLGKQIREFNPVTKAAAQIVGYVSPELGEVINQIDNTKPLADLGVPRPQGFTGQQNNLPEQLIQDAASVVPSMVAGGPIRAGANLLPQVAKGALEGGLYSATQDQNAGVGATTAAMGTAAIPIAGRVIAKIAPPIMSAAKKIWQRVTGKSPNVAMFDEAGNPTPEMKAVLAAEGKTVDDLAKEAEVISDVAPSMQADDLARQAQMGVNASRGAPESTSAPPRADFKPEEAIAKDAVKKRFDELAGEVDVDPEIRGAARRLDIDVNPSVYSRNPTYIEIEQGLASMPGSELNKINVQSVQKLAERADDLITEFGGMVDKSEFASTFAKKNEDIIEGLAKQSDEIYETLNKGIPPSAKVNASNLRTFLEKRAEEFGGLEDLNPLEKSLLARLQKGEITYAKLDDLRKQLGRAAYGKGEDVFRNADSALLKQMERALLEDQRIVAESFDQLGAFDAARGLVKQRKIIEGNLKEAFGKKVQRDVVPVLGSALKDMSTKGSVKQFEKVMRAVPDDMKESAVLTAMNDVFTGTKNKEAISIAGFSNWFNGVRRNKEAFNLLKKYLKPEAINRLNDMGILANGIAKAQKAYIPTGRSTLIPQMFEELDGPIAKIFKAGMQKGAGIGLDIATGTPGAFTFLSTITKPMRKSKAKAADELFASKKFRDTVEARYVKGEEAGRKEAEILTKTKVYKDWLDSQNDATKKAINARGFYNWFIQKEEPEMEAETQTNKEEE